MIYNAKQIEKGLCVGISLFFALLPESSHHASRQLVGEAAPGQEAAQAITKLRVVHLRSLQQGASFFATRAQGQLLVVFVADRLIDNLALDAFQAQLIAQSLRAARIKLLAVLHPERSEGPVVDVIQATQAFEHRLDNLRGRLFLAQVAAHLRLAAGTEREIVNCALNRLLARLLAFKLFEVGVGDLLVEMQIELEHQLRANAEREYAVEIEIDALRAVRLLFESGNTHADTIAHPEKRGKLAFLLFIDSMVFLGKIV